jgi:hypothetical protein
LFAGPAVSKQPRGTKSIDFKGFFGLKTKNPVHFGRIGFRRVLLNFYRFSTLFFPASENAGASWTLKPRVDVSKVTGVTKKCQVWGKIFFKSPLQKCNTKPPSPPPMRKTTNAANGLALNC